MCGVPRPLKRDDLRITDIAHGLHTGADDLAGHDQSPCGLGTAGHAAVEARPAQAKLVVEHIEQRCLRIDDYGVHLPIHLESAGS